MSLRSVTFDAEIIRGLVLGDLEDKVIPLKVLVMCEAKPFTSSYILGLQVTKPDGVEVRVKDSLPVKSFTVGSSPEQVLWQAFVSMARKMSFQLFEVDPRIGLPLTSNSMVPFPSSPLFDPPYITAPYPRYLVPVYDRDERLSTEEAQTARHLKHCPFCRTAIYPFYGARKPGVWCGGNVGFAHEECAPWVTPITDLASV